MKSLFCRKQGALGLPTIKLNYRCAEKALSYMIKHRLEFLPSDDASQVTETVTV
jgi:hypothetical protein